MNARKTVRRKPRSFKVWVWPVSFANDMKNGDAGWVHKRKSGFSYRVPATLTLSPPKKGRK